MKLVELLGSEMLLTRQLPLIRRLFIGDSFGVIGKLIEYLAHRGRISTLLLLLSMKLAGQPLPWLSLKRLKMCWKVASRRALPFS
jgi:hypothetical protein